jgi:predicted phage tail protein
MSSLLRKVYLHGPFAKFHDGPITVVGDTVAEIIESVTRQVKGFHPHPIYGRKRIRVVGFHSQESLYQPLDVEELHIVPQLNGGKDNGALIQIVLGVALVAVGFAISSVPGIGMLGSIAIKVGFMMALGGLSQMLAPQPEADKDEAIKNRYLGSPRNTVQIGTRIPILYGEAPVYGHYLSFDINALEFRGDTDDSSTGAK